MGIGSKLTEEQKALEKTAHPFSLGFPQCFSEPLWTDHQGYFPSYKGQITRGDKSSEDTPSLESEMAGVQMPSLGCVCVCVCVVWCQFVLCVCVCCVCEYTKHLRWNFQIHFQRRFWL